MHHVHDYYKADFAADLATLLPEWTAWLADRNGMPAHLADRCRPYAHGESHKEIKAMARELVALMVEVPKDSFELDVEISIPADVRAELEISERLRQEAATRQTEAARHLRLAVRRLRRRGLVSRDVGEMLGVSAARAKQLDSEAPNLVDA